jgi:hypothetical protein
MKLTDWLTQEGYGFRPDTADPTLIELTGEWLTGMSRDVFTVDATITQTASNAGQVIYKIEDTGCDAFRLEIYGGGSGPNGSICDWAEWMDAHSFVVIFDNGGGITLQVASGYNHSYDDGKQAGEDVKLLLAGADPADWDGNDSAAGTVRCTGADVRNGGARKLSSEEIAEIVEAGELDECWGYAMGEFFSALGVTNVNYQYLASGRKGRWVIKAGGVARG